MSTTRWTARCDSGPAASAWPPSSPSPARASETALFLYPTFQAHGAGPGPALGAVLGIATAVLVGVLLYRGSISLDLAAFFRLTGAFLIVIAAGVAAYGIHDLQEAGILPGLDQLAWDIEGYRASSWYGSIVKGIFNLGPQMTVLEVTTYVAYLVPTMALFLRPTAGPRRAARADSPTTV
ncbi:MAG: FTR1 family protein [Acidimicrobiales bacterium]